MLGVRHIFKGGNDSLEFLLPLLLSTVKSWLHATKKLCVDFLTAASFNH